jgi:hypothetical protein
LIQSIPPHPTFWSMKNKKAEILWALVLIRGIQAAIAKYPVSRSLVVIPSQVKGSVRSNSCSTALFVPWKSLESALTVKSWPVGWAWEAFMWKRRVVCCNYRIWLLETLQD